MTSKTEVEIEKEKDAVAKMIGAKSAMQSMIERHDRLVAALQFTNTILTDMTKCVGEDVYIRTFQHGERESGPQFVKLKDQVKRVSDRARELI